MSCRHKWVYPYQVVGGLLENPGCWDAGNGAMMTKAVCSKCGKYRVEIRSYCGERDGDKRVTFRPADKVSLEWLWRE